MKKNFSIIILILIGIFVIHNECPAQEKPIPNIVEISYEVLIDDKPIEGKYEIVSIDVEIKPKKTFAEIKILLKNNKIDFSALGRNISIMLGYQNEMEKVFMGKIVEQKIKQFSTEPLMMKIECEGMSLKNKLFKSPVIVLEQGANVIGFEFELSAGFKFEGELLINGIAQSLIGNKVELKGFGNQFDGEVRITKVKHAVKEGKWTTKIFAEHKK